MKLKLTGTEEELYRIRVEIQQHRSGIGYDSSKQSSTDLKKTEQFNKLKLDSHNRDPQTIIAALRN